MSDKLKEIDIRNGSYYFFDDIINVKRLDSNKIKIDEKPYKNILIYYFGYVMFKDLSYVAINSVNPLYLIINKISDYIEASNGNKHLGLVPTA